MAGPKRFFFFFYSSFFQLGQIVVILFLLQLWDEYFQLWILKKLGSQKRKFSKRFFGLVQ